MSEATTPERPNKSKAAKRRRTKRIIKIVVWVLLLAAIAAGGYWYYTQQKQKAEAENAVTYTQAMARTGTLDVTVYGSGMVEAASQPVLTAQSDGAVSELRVGIGDEVTEGQVLAVLENKTLNEKIKELEYSLWDLDSTITAAASAGEVTSILAPSAGRIMKIYAQSGDDALAVYRQEGSVAILSTDGRMKVSFAVTDGAQLTLGDVVTVEGDGFARDGTVTELYLQGTQATVTILDDTLPMDAPVTIADASGALLGEGSLQINKPMAVSAFGGTIKDVRVREGMNVPQKYVLFTLEDAPNSLEMEDLRIQREAAADSLEEAVALRESLIITSPVDGVVSSVAISQGGSVKEGDALITLLEGEEMRLTIAVDELDVVEVAEGQAVAISVDALPNLSLEGIVEKIAPVGSGSGGVSTYDVLLGFTAEGTGVRPGMNASGEIRVARAENAVYIPVEALMTIGDNSFVMVADSDEGGSSGAPVMMSAEDGGERSMPEGMADGGEGGFSGAPAMVNASEGGGMPSGSGERPTGSGETSQRGSRMGGEAMMMGTSATSEGGAMRAVETGLVNDDYVEILSGLSAGEIVLYQSASSSSSSMGGYSMMSVGGGMATVQMSTPRMGN